MRLCDPYTIFTDVLQRLRSIQAFEDYPNLVQKTNSLDSLLLKDDNTLNHFASAWELSNTWVAIRPK